MTTETKSTIQGYFNAIARRYDILNSILSFGLHHFWKRAAIRLAALQPGSAVADICGGTADLALRAANAVGSDGHVAVYDFSFEMMRAGTAKCTLAAAPAPIAFVCGDAELMALKNNSFDAALIGFGLRNLRDREQGLREMYRILKPGGRLVCLEFSQPAWKWFRCLYDLYSFAFIPLAGKLVTGSHAAYAYLPESIRRFPAPDKLAAMMADANFTAIEYKRLLNGIAVIHVGKKADG